MSYENIIHMPRHISKTHSPMSRAERAAQFAPFAALTGYEMAVSEAARMTRCKIELDAQEISRLNEKLKITELALNRMIVKITYFIPDCFKDGGDYITLSGKVQSIDKIKKSVKMVCGANIPIDDIVGIELDADYIYSMIA